MRWRLPAALAQRAAIFASLHSHSNTPAFSTRLYDIWVKAIAGLANDPLGTSRGQPNIGPTASCAIAHVLALRTVRAEATGRPTCWELLQCPSAAATGRPDHLHVAGLVENVGKSDQGKRAVRI